MSESAVGTWTAWPVWGGRWRWQARLGAANIRRGEKGSGSEARVAAIDALSDLRRLRATAAKRRSA